VNSNVSAWTFGGSVLSFAFPMLLFIVVASALYVLYTKPEFVPGHRAPGVERPVSYTPVPGRPIVDARAQAQPAAAQTAQPAAQTAPAPAAAAQTAPASPGEATPADAGEAAGTEDTE
jgi:hypothetical protein